MYICLCFSSLSFPYPTICECECGCLRVSGEYKHARWLKSEYSFGGWSSSTLFQTIQTSFYCHVYPRLHMCTQLSWPLNLWGFVYLCPGFLCCTALENALFCLAFVCAPGTLTLVLTRTWQGLNSLSHHPSGRCTQVTFVKMLRNS